MKIFKNDFDKLYEELSTLNEDIVTLPYKLSDISDSNLSSLFNITPQGISITFSNIIKLNSIKPDFEEADVTSTDLFKCWALVKYIMSTKHNRDGQNDNKKYWIDRLCNAFYKPYLTEKGLLDTINTHNILKKLDLIYTTGEQEHSCIYEGKGQDIPDFKSQSTGFFFECKPHTGDSNPHRDTDNKTFIIRYSTNYTTRKGVFYIESFPAVFKNFKATNEKVFSAPEWDFIESIWVNSLYAKNRLSANVPYIIDEVALNIDKMDHPCRDLFKKLDGVSGISELDTRKESEIHLADYIINGDTLTSAEVEQICDTLDEYKNIYLEVKNHWFKNKGVGAVYNFYVNADNFYETSIDEVDNALTKEFWELVNKKASLAANLSNIDLTRFKKDLDNLNVTEKSQNKSKSSKSKKSKK